MYSYAVLYVAISDKFYDHKAGTVLVVSLNISLPFLVGKDFFPGTVTSPSMQ